MEKRFTELREQLPGGPDGDVAWIVCHARALPAKEGRVNMQVLHDALSAEGKERVKELGTTLGKFCRRYPAVFEVCDAGALLALRGGYAPPELPAPAPADAKADGEGGAPARKPPPRAGRSPARGGRSPARGAEISHTMTLHVGGGESGVVKVTRHRTPPRRAEGDDAAQPSASPGRRSPARQYRGTGQDFPESTAPMEAGWWRYRFTPANGQPLNCRCKPAIDADVLRAEEGADPACVLRPGDDFDVVRRVDGADKVKYLHLGDAKGWAFDRCPGVGAMCSQIVREK